MLKTGVCLKIYVQTSPILRTLKNGECTCLKPAGDSREITCNKGSRDTSHKLMSRCGGGMGNGAPRWLGCWLQGGKWVGTGGYALFLPHYDKHQRHRNFVNKPSYLVWDRTLMFVFILVHGNSQTKLSYFGDFIW